MLKIKIQSTFGQNNKTHCPFSDQDILILLKGLKERDRDDLDENKICLDPITLDDYSLELILSKYLHFFKGDRSFEKVSLICPIKVSGEFHWNLLEIKKDGTSIKAILYDTNGCTKRLDNHLKDAIQQRLMLTETLDKEG